MRILLPITGTSSKARWLRTCAGLAAWVLCAGCASTRLAALKPEEDKGVSLCAAESTVSVANLGAVLAKVDGDVRLWGFQNFPSGPTTQPEDMGRILSTLLLDVDSPKHLSATRLELEYLHAAGLRVTAFADNVMLAERRIPHADLHCTPEGLTYDLPGDWGYIAGPNHRSMNLTFRTRSDGALDALLRARITSLTLFLLPSTLKFSEVLRFAPLPVAAEASPVSVAVTSSHCPDLSGEYDARSLSLHGDGRGMDNGAVSIELADLFRHKKHEQSAPFTADAGAGSVSLSVPEGGGLILAESGSQEMIAAVSPNEITCNGGRWKLKLAADRAEAGMGALYTATAAAITMGAFVLVGWDEAFLDQGPQGELLVESVSRSEGAALLVIPLHKSQSLWSRFARKH